MGVPLVPLDLAPGAGCTEKVASLSATCVADMVGCFGFVRYEERVRSESNVYLVLGLDWLNGCGVYMGVQ